MLADRFRIGSSIHHAIDRMRRHQIPLAKRMVLNEASGYTAEFES